MPTNQEGRHEGARAISGTALDYNGDFIAMFEAHGITTGTFNERFLLWLNYQLGASYTSLPQAMQEYAVAIGFSNWDAVNTITHLQGSPSYFLLEDGASYFLMEDGTSKYLRQ